MTLPTSGGELGVIAKNLPKQLTKFALNVQRAMGWDVLACHPSAF
jgi:hypothetical protein